MKAHPQLIPLTGRARALALSQESCSGTIEALRRTIDTGREIGFAGFSVDLPSTRVDVWWRGEVPPVLRLVAEASGIEVRFHRALHTLEFLERGLAMVMDGRVGSSPLDPALRELGITINTGRIAHDGSGISFTASVTAGLPVPGVLERACELIAEAAQVPVRIVLGEAPVPVAARA